jgi:DNA-binding SARP family transcriptional activator/class 3 adenylate cyclase
VPNLPRGTVTFLFTDIEGSTRLLEQLRDGYAQAIEEHREILEAAVEESGGQAVDTQGDAFFVAFPRAKDAVAAAVSAQRALAAHSWPEGAQVRVRMGIHTGEPAVASDRYVGLGVHRAARICAAGHGGQILVSQSTRELLRDDPPQETELRDLGEQRLKDFDRPQRVFQVVAAGLRDDFPPLSTAVAHSTARVAGWDFRILGPLEVSNNGEPVALGGPRVRSVLALLLVHAGEVVSSDRLVTELWGEEPPRTAMTSLQNSISQLRKLLGSERVLTRSPGYVLRVEEDELDLRRFERLVARSRDAEPERRSELLSDALALWRGPPLADFSFDSFAQNEIRRLEELRLTALEDRCAAELERGRHRELVAELEVLVAANPLRERLREQLMLALYRSGRQAEALEAYQRARRTLVDELGIEPGPALQRLNASILRQDAPLEARPAADVDADHYEEVTKTLLAGRLVVVLGFGANLAERPDDAEWSDAERRFPPTATDVAMFLARRFDYPHDHAGDLARVSEYVALTKGVGPLYDELHAMFDRDYPPGPVHTFAAEIARLARAAGAPYPLVVTTHYDRTLERAFADADEEVDVVCYIAAGRSRGKFLHLEPAGEASVIEIPNAYAELSLKERPAILKLHGQVDSRPERDHESFVISEDDYIGYLAQAEIANVLPVNLAAKLRRSHYLFLGYALEEWHLRVFLHRIWGDQQAAYRSWAIQPNPGVLTRQYWRNRNVDILDLPLAEYVAHVRDRLGALGTAA